MRGWYKVLLITALVSLNYLQTSNVNKTAAICVHSLHSMAKWGKTVYIHAFVFVLRYKNDSNASNGYILCNFASHSCVSDSLLASCHSATSKLPARDAQKLGLFKKKRQIL